MAPSVPNSAPERPLAQVPARGRAGRAEIATESGASKPACERERHSICGTARTAFGISPLFGTCLARAGAAGAAGRVHARPVMRGPSPGAFFVAMAATSLKSLIEWDASRERTL